MVAELRTGSENPSSPKHMPTKSERGLRLLVGFGSGLWGLGFSKVGLRFSLDRILQGRKCKALDLHVE